MSTATRPHRQLRELIGIPPIREVHAPRWFDRLPTWLSAGGILALLMAVSLVLRTRQLSGELWFNEAIATGIAQHSLGGVFGAVRDAGGAPLYYLLLNLWVSAAGTSAAAVHWLSELFALLAIAAAMWVGWSLGGRRAGIFAAVLFAFSSYMTQFAQEAQPYALLVLLSLLSTAGFVNGFVYRRRRYLWLFTLGLTAMLYTQLTAGLYAFGAACAVLVIHRLTDSERRAGLLLDAGICFICAAVLFVPWLPATIHQIGHDTSPWHYTPMASASLPSQITGGDRVDVTLLVALLVGCVPLMAGGRRRSRAAVTIWALIALALCGIVLGRIGSIAGPSYVARYYGVLVAPVLLLAALGSARAKVVGVIAIVLCVAFLANPNSFAPAHKTNMQQLAGQLGPSLRAGDAVALAQPEQVPLADYYLPSGLRWFSTLGPVSSPNAIDWSDAYRRLQDAAPAQTIGNAVASLRPGQQLLVVRPLTEGVENWKAPWAELVRRRAAQWGQVLTRDVADGTLTQVADAPASYQSACCVASSAVLYRKAH